MKSDIYLYMKTIDLSLLSKEVKESRVVESRNFERQLVTIAQKVKMSFSRFESLEVFEGERLTGVSLCVSTHALLL